MASKELARLNQAFANSLPRQWASPLTFHLSNMNILGISAFYHDSAATILIDGKIIAAAQEERFTRKKHDPSYPYNAIEFVLNYSNLRLSEVDQIVFFEKPF